MAEKAAGGALAKRHTGAEEENEAGVPFGDGEISGDGGDQARRAAQPGKAKHRRRRPADLLGSTFPAEPAREWCCIEGPGPIWYLPVD